MGLGPTGRKNDVTHSEYSMFSQFFLLIICISQHLYLNLQRVPLYDGDTHFFYLLKIPATNYHLQTGMNGQF